MAPLTPEAKARLSCRLQHQLSAALCHEPLDHRETQTCAFADAFRREEWLGGICECLCIHPLSLIGNQKADVVACCERVSTACCHIPPLRRDGDFATIRHCIARIDDEVEERTLQLIGVGKHGGEDQLETRC